MIGASAGGILALKTIFGKLKKPLSCPVLVVIHRPKNGSSRLGEVLSYSTVLTIKEAEDKEPLQAGIIYLAPSNHHLLVDPKGIISLSSSGRLNFSRPSIDATFLNVANIYGKNITSILLTGANNDGAVGTGKISNQGGKTIVQNLQEAYIPVMPSTALEMAPNSLQMTLHEISDYLLSNHTL